MNYRKELRIALEAVARAASLCRMARRTLVTEETIQKTDRSPVTVADYGSQAVISLILKGAFPADPIVAEEDPAPLTTATDLREKVVQLATAAHAPVSEREVLDAIAPGCPASESASRFWAVDPIDGTKGFLRNEHYAVALALIDNHRVAVGVLGCPDFTKDGITLFWAASGQGAFMTSLSSGRETPLSVSPLDRTHEARICESVESAHADHEAHARIARVLGVTRTGLRMDSQAKYAAVASGLADIYLRLPRKRSYQEKIWDHAAGALIVEEAGGRVSDFHGRPLDFSTGRILINNHGVLATNGRLHEAALAAVATIAT